MAKKKGIETSGAEVRAGFRSFKRDSGKFYELNEGESLEGVILGIRLQFIKDKRTKQPKEIQVYKIRQEDGAIVNLAGRLLLDQQFADARDEMFGGSFDNLRGLKVIINRGEDTETGEGNPMGTYELMIEDPDQVKI
jgi:hypothetical protein